MKALAIRNGLWNALANAVGTASGLIGSILVVRSLSPAEYGTLSFYLWLASLLAVLGTLALPQSVTKVTSELKGSDRLDEMRRLSRWVLRLVLVLNLVLTAGAVIWAILQPGESRPFLVAIALTLVPNGLAAILRSTLWGKERYRPVSITFAVAAILQLALIALVYVLQLGALGYLVALLSVNVLQVFGLAWAVARLRREEPALPDRQWPAPDVLRKYAAFVLPATLVYLYEVIIWQRSEIFFLEHFSTREAIGYYSLAYTSFSMFLTLGWALVNGFYPAISRDYGANDWARIEQKIRQGLVLATLFAVPLSFGGWATLDTLITLLYGDKMAPSIPVAQVLLAGLWPGVITAMFSLSVNAIGGVWLQVRLGAILVVVNIALNLITIPPLGALGAAASNTATQIIYTGLLSILFARRYRVRFPLKHITAIVAVGAITTFVLPRLLQGWLPGIVGFAGAIAAAGCAYVALVWGLGCLNGLQAKEAGA